MPDFQTSRSVRRGNKVNGLGDWRSQAPSYQFGELSGRNHYGRQSTWVFVDLPSWKQMLGSKYLCFLVRNDLTSPYMMNFKSDISVQDDQFGGFARQSWGTCTTTVRIDLRVHSMTQKEPDIYPALCQDISKAHPPLDVFVVMREVYYWICRFDGWERKLPWCLASCATLHHNNLVLSNGQREQLLWLNAGDCQTSNQCGFCRSVLRMATREDVARWPLQNRDRWRCGIIAAWQGWDLSATHWRWSPFEVSCDQKSPMK